MDLLDTLARLLGRPPAHEVVRHDLGWTPALRAPKRPPPDDPTAAIAAFWTWWAEAAPLLDRVDVEPPSQAVLKGLDTHLMGLHRELAWELGPGTTRKHALTVSPDGVSALRSLTAAWRAAAPTDAGDWEFHDVRPPVPGAAVDLELETTGRVVRGRDVQVAVFDDEDHHRLDVWIHHPELVRASRRDRWSLAFLLVDAALGEARVATWLRTITPSPRPLAEVPEIRETVVVRDLDGLRARVAVREAEGDAAPPPLPDSPGAFQIDPRARRWRHPSYDTRLRFTVAPDRGPALEAALQAHAEQVVAAVRHRRGAELLVDAYAAAGSPVGEAIAAAVEGARVAHQRDPGWALAGR